MNGWTFNKVGRELQGLVLKRKLIKLSMLNEKIKAIQEKLEPIKETNQMKEFNINIKKKLEKLTKKHRKRKSRSSIGTQMISKLTLFMFGRLLLEWLMVILLPKVIRHGVLITLSLNLRVKNQETKVKVDRD